MGQRRLAHAREPIFHEFPAPEIQALRTYPVPHQSRVSALADLPFRRAMHPTLSVHLEWSPSVESTLPTHRDPPLSQSTAAPRTGPMVYQHHDRASLLATRVHA